jgi:glycosyltransferase involved in cell wall biosynthesis
MAAGNCVGVREVMDRRPNLSLIVPTRGLIDSLRRFIESVATTAYHPERIEVILVVDSDDKESLDVVDYRLNTRYAIGPPGRTMGELNNAGYEAASADYVMLLNDDVIIRTPGWDVTILNCFNRFPDPFVLVHVNDTLIREHLCTFPVVSRSFCERAGSICPSEYIRYRIDDHIEDIFNLVAVLGERRTVYLPDVVFEHTNSVHHPEAGQIYLSDPRVLALDAPRFEALFSDRKELALRILAEINGTSDPLWLEARRKILNQVSDSFAIRYSGRQHLVRYPGAMALDWFRRFVTLIARARNSVNRKGYYGFVRVVAQKLLRFMATVSMKGRLQKL